MYIVTAEAEDGTWFCEPIGADSKDEARKLAAETWSARFALPRGVTAVMYSCSLVEVVDLPNEKPK